MSTELIINASLPETRIALMENGEIQETLIERASGKGIVGNIYKGRVTRVLPGMQAAFVDIGLEKAAFLYVDDVYVHSEIWEKEEGTPEEEAVSPAVEIQTGEVDPNTPPVSSESAGEAAGFVSGPEGEAGAKASPASSMAGVGGTGIGEPGAQELHRGATDDMSEMEAEWAEEIADEQGDQDAEADDEGEDADDPDEGDEPVGMAPGPEGGGGEGEDGGGSNDSSRNSEQPAGTISANAGGRAGSAEDGGEAADGGPGGSESGRGAGPRRRHRRGRRGGRLRRERNELRPQAERPQGAEAEGAQGEYPESFHSQVSEEGSLESDRTALGAQQGEVNESNRPGASGASERAVQSLTSAPAGKQRPEFKEQRGRDRRIRSKGSARQSRAQVNIQDLLKEGQEVLVQVAKDPIATKGARLTCHISLPGRHLVCMPTIDHVGVSRRIERDDDRRRLRDFVERNRPRNLGFIVRTASGKQSEKRVKQDIEYLTRLWDEIREKSANLTAPALVYEDLNAVLRAIRDWVTEDIDKILVDSRYHYNEMQRFVSHFMPSLRQKLELYHGDVPIFDAYGISAELARALERKVWLKSGGYIVIDQAEALVAIDVNTGRYVGKKNLEDTILKTNLEAVQEIAYQLRLRNAGGIIILDLIDMEKEENKHRVYRALEEALKKDRARPSILKISELGLVEMTRKRTRDTMVRSLCESCSHCEGKGYIKSKQTVAYEVLREIERDGIERDVSKILVQAHPDVIDILAIDERETLDQLERRYRKQVYLQAAPDYHLEQFEVVGDKVGRKEVEIGRGRDRDRDRDREGGREGGRDRGRRGRGRDRGRGGSDREGRESRESRETREGGQPILISLRQPSTASAGQAQGDEEGLSGAQEGERRMIIPRPELSGETAAPTESGQAGESEGGAGGAEGVAAQERARGQDDFYDEEDRLAFLRAQAAQDAALARLGQGGGGGGAGVGGLRAGGMGRPGGRGAGDERGAARAGAEERGGRRRRRGRRGGGKFGRGGRPSGPGPSGPNGTAGGNGGGMKGSQGSLAPEGASAPRSSTSSSSSSSSDGND